MRFNRFSFFVFLLFSVLSNRAQLTGIAYLNGQPIHAGIKVKFIANGSPAITDSTFTNSNGTYSINISGGIYSVIFTSNGYQPVYYNAGTSVILTNTMVLNTVNLFPGNVINVSGNVSGNWTSNNIYVVQNNIAIVPGATLTIQPGTVVKFNGNYSLTVSGILSAIGSNSNKIIFTSNASPPIHGDWTGIIINTSPSVVQNCLIEYAETGLEIKNSSPLITNNEIIKFLVFGILLENSSSLVKENLIHDFNALWYTQGITCDNSNSIIECNTIFDGARSGIRPSPNDLVKNNIVHHILEPTRGYGIDCGWNVKSLVENNLVFNCVIGIRIGESVTPAPNPRVINNTIYFNETGVMFDQLATGILVNNLITSNFTGVVQTSTGSATTPSLISHNLFWNNSLGNFNGVQILGLGQIVNLNTNGDPIDSYSNLFIDPMLVNNVPPYYDPGSPCMNAGNPVYSSHIGCDTSKFCTSMLVGLNRLPEKLKISLFPNPFKTYLNIKNYRSEEIQHIRIYDLSGKAYSCEFQNESDNSVRVHLEGLQPGIYIMELHIKGYEKHHYKIIKE